MKIVVTTTREANDFLIDKAKFVAKDLDIEYIDRENLSIEKLLLQKKFDYLLLVEKDKLVLKSQENTVFWHPNMAELKINSIKQGNKDSLIEATGAKEGYKILDCTLGLAGDSLVFSSVVGKKGLVVGTEINKYISYLSKEGLANYNNKEYKLLNNIKVINCSYKEYLLKQPDNSFDIVYFDPMFKKSNKKSTTINSFRDFAEHKALTKEILVEAIRVAKRRVVVKERAFLNDLKSLGIEKYYGGKRSGSIIYGIIDKRELEVH